MKPLFATVLITLFFSCGQSKTASEESTVQTQKAPEFVNSFDFKPEPPVNGKLLGIIELGYSGFNSFIVKMDDQDRWSLEKADYSESHVAENEVTFNHVISEIRRFKKDMIEYGVDPYDINLVASSSAIKNKKVSRIASRLRSLNIGMITVNAEQEGTFALFATVPRQMLEHSFMVDIGSGNTKVSWLQDGVPTTLETYGSKYFQQGTNDSVVSKSIKNLIAKVPEENKKMCFMVGKIPFLLATITDHRDGRYTVLEEPTRYQVTDIQEKSGLVIYEGIYEPNTMSYVFDWESNFSIGVLMSVN